MLSSDEGQAVMTRSTLERGQLGWACGTRSRASRMGRGQVDSGSAASPPGREGGGWWGGGKGEGEGGGLFGISEGTSWDVTAGIGTPDWSC